VLDRQSADDLRSATPDLTSPSSSTISLPVSGAPRAVRSVRRPVLARLRRAVYRPRRVMRPQQIMSDCSHHARHLRGDVGEIKTRIEPQLVSGYKRPLSLSY
jgi:hypothetical protein